MSKPNPAPMPAPVTLDASVRDAIEAALPAYVAARRWYRTKSKRVERARLEAWFPLGSGAIAVVEFDLEGGERDRYVLPIAARRSVAGSGASAAGEAEPPITRVGDVEIASGASSAAWLDALLAALMDATSGPREIADALGSPGSLRLRASAAALAPDGEAASPEGRRAEPLTARVRSGEQTNTSVVYGDRFVAKIVRKLDDGVSPELELGRFLTDAGYAAAPRLEAWVDVVRGPGAPSATLGFLHAHVANQGDAWSTLLADLAAWLDAVAPSASEARTGGGGGSAGGDSAGGDGDSARGDGEVRGDGADHLLARLVARASLLGRRVGELHAVLSSPVAYEEEALAPVPFDAAARTRVCEAIRAELVDVLATPGRTTGIAPASGDGPLVAALLARVALAEQVEDAGCLTRVHGDLHLGQILVTDAGDFAILDFEGEPSRSLAERRAKRSPLVDVAGLARSYHYASVVALRGRPAQERSSLAGATERFHREAVAALVGGWCEATEALDTRPRSRAALAALFDLFLLEKTLYEVRYERDNRPDWIDVPLAGLRALGAADRGASAIVASR